jgi:hypothetical protein
MTLNKVKSEDLLAELEKIRAAKYPCIPAELIRVIVDTEFQYADDRAEASRNTKKLIDNYLRDNFV